MWHTLYKAINYLDVVPPFMLLIMELARMRSTGRDFVVYYLGCQLLFNGYATILNILEKTNLFAYSLNFSWSYFLLTLYFAKLYSSSLLTRLLAGLVIIYQIYFITTLQSPGATSAFDSISYGLISLLITFFSLYYYTRQLTEQPKENILKSRDFWYVNGIFTYYASNFFIFLTYNRLVSQNDVNIGVIWKIHNVVFLIMCIYFFMGMRCKISTVE